MYYIISENKKEFKAKGIKINDFDLLNDDEFKNLNKN